MRFISAAVPSCSIESIAMCFRGPELVREGTLADVCAASRGISHNAVVGTLAAWTLRYCPFAFCGSQREAADFSFRSLAAQARDAERTAKAISLPAVPPHLPARQKPVAGILAQKRPLPRIGAKSNYPEETCQP